MNRFNRLIKKLNQLYKKNSRGGGDNQQVTLCLYAFSDPLNPLVLPL